MLRLAFPLPERVYSPPICPDLPGGPVPQPRGRREATRLRRMEVLQLMFDFILHVDDHLAAIANQFDHRRLQARASAGEA